MTEVDNRDLVAFTKYQQDRIEALTRALRDCERERDRWQSFALALSEALERKWRGEVEAIAKAERRL